MLPFVPHTPRSYVKRGKIVHPLYGLPVAGLSGNHPAIEMRGVAVFRFDAGGQRIVFAEIYGDTLHLLEQLGLNLYGKLPSTPTSRTSGGVRAATTTTAGGISGIVGRAIESVKEVVAPLTETVKGTVKGTGSMGTKK